MQSRTLKLLSDDHPAIAYTDGAYEDGVGISGGVVIIPCLGIRAMHWGKVPGVAIEEWKSVGLTQLICQIELFAALLVRFKYRAKLSNIAHRS